MDTLLQTPPHNTDAESAVIGAMLKDNSRIPLVRLILPSVDSFFKDHNQTIAGLIYKMADEGRPVDCVTLSNELHTTEKAKDVGGYKIIEEFTSLCPAPVNAESYAKIVKEHWLDRELYHATRDTLRNVQDRAGSVQDRLQWHFDRLNKITTGSMFAGEFPPPLPLSLLPKTGGIQWIMQDFIAKGMVTLFVALWKSGKTTWESILLRLMGEPQATQFCGREVNPGKAIILTEEPTAIWEQRRDHHPLQDNVSLITRHDLPNIDSATWPRLCRYLAAISQRDGVSLVIIDPMSSFWPIKDENDNAQVSQAFLALREITKAGIAVLVLHHPGKSDAGIGKLSRGASSFSGAADICIEMRRENEQDLTDRRRKIDWYGRVGTGNVMIELSEDEREYTVLGTAKEVNAQDRVAIIAGLLPTSSPGLTPEEVREKWPSTRRPKIQDLRNALVNNSDAQAKQPVRWHRDGSGTKGNPFRYWILPSATG